MVSRKKESATSRRQPIKLVDKYEQINKKERKKKQNWLKYNGSSEWERMKCCWNVCSVIANDTTIGVISIMQYSGNFSLSRFERVYRKIKWLTNWKVKYSHWNFCFQCELKCKFNKKKHSRANPIQKKTIKAPRLSSLLLLLLLVNVFPLYVHTLQLDNDDVSRMNINHHYMKLKGRRKKNEQRKNGKNCWTNRKSMKHKRLMLITNKKRGENTKKTNHEMWINQTQTHTHNSIKLKPYEKKRKPKKEHTTTTWERSHVCHINCFFCILLKICTLTHTERFIRIFDLFSSQEMRWNKTGIMSWDFIIFERANTPWVCAICKQIYFFCYFFCWANFEY